MSTYIQGVQDYIPRLQSFKPDFNFFGGAMGMKQGQYDSAYAQTSNFYGSLLNSPLLRDSNIQAREDYFKAIEGEIKKVASLDLSKAENVQSAMGLFSGLYENENIVKDMVWTQNYQKELQRGEGFRNCVNPDDCGGGFWEGGIKALNYKAMEFRNATDEQAMGMGNVRYTPYQNVMEKAIKYAKDAGLNITVDQLQGRYITTTKNGPMLIDPLNSLFTGLFANDQAIMDYYKTQAYVNRKDWVQANVPVYGSEAAAELAYVDTVSMSMGAMFGMQKEDVDARLNNFSGQKAQLEERIRTEGTNPNSSLAEQYRQLNDIEEQIQMSSDHINNTYGYYQNAMDPAMRAQMSENIDQAMASMLLAGDIGNAAQTLAYKDYEFKMKADPYALENVKQANRIALENHRFGNNKLLAKYKYDLEHWEEKLASQGGEFDNVPILKKLIEGGADINLEDGMAHKIFKDKQGNMLLDISGGERSILDEMYTVTLEQSKAEGGRGVATDDLVRLGEIYFEQMMDSDLMVVRGGELVSASISQHDAVKLKAEWDSKSYEDKVAFMQSQRASNLIGGDVLSGTVLDNIYNDFVLPMMDMTNEYNSVNRSHLAPLWESSVDKRVDIQNKNNLLQDMGEWYTNETNKVIQNMKGSPDDAIVGSVDLVRMLIDPKTGHKRGEAEFVSMYMNGFKYFRRSMTMDELGDLGRKIYRGEVTLDEHVKDIDLDQTLPDLWAQSFSKHMDPEGGAIALGLIGSDSSVAMGINFPAVDPSKYASSATMNTVSFMRDMFTAGSEGTRFKLGGPTEALPGASDDKAEAFFNQLYQDMINMKDAKDDDRPILNVVYQDIAGGDEGWTALNIKVNAPYVDQYLGSKENPGLTKGIDNQLMTEGLTLYLDKSAATNGFRQGVEKSPLEQTMYYTGKYDFDTYPDYTKDLRMTTNPEGGYTVQGQVASGFKEDGTPNWKAVYFPYNSLSTDPTMVVAEVNAWLENVKQGNDYMFAEFNNKNGTYTPEELLNR